MLEKMIVNHDATDGAWFNLAGASTDGPSTINRAIGGDCNRSLYTGCAQFPVYDYLHLSCFV